MSQRKLERILRRLRDGKRWSRRWPCQGMPSKQAVRQMGAEHPDARVALARARDEGEDETLDEMLTIADSAPATRYKSPASVDARARRVLARRAGAAASVVVNNTTSTIGRVSFDIPMGQWPQELRIRFAQVSRSR